MTDSTLRTTPRPWTPILLGLAVALLATLTWVQWSHPYIEHDDWDMLLSNRPSFVENHTARLLHEGRWLNDWWWALGSQSLSPRGAVILFTGGWLVTVAVMVRSIAIRWWSVPAVVALYAAPMMSMLSFWPATLAAPIWALAVTTVLLWLTRDRWLLHVLVVAVGTVVISLGYPPLALLLLTLLVALHHERSSRHLAVLAGTFVLAYLAGILVIFALNDLRFGVFGLEIQAWRHPSQLTGLPSLGRHLNRVLTNWGNVLRPMTLPLIAGGVALVVALRERTLRRGLLIAALAFLVGAILSASSTITNGVDVPPRAMAWFWPMLVLVAAWGVGAVRARRTWIAGTLLTLIALWAALYAAYAAVGHQPTQRVLDTLRQTVVSEQRQHPAAPIEFTIAPTPTSAVQRQAIWEVGNALAKFDGITRTQFCGECLPAPGPLDPRDPAQWVVFDQARIVIRLPGSLTGTDLHGVREPRWLEPFH